VTCNLEVRLLLVETLQAQHLQGTASGFVTEAMPELPCFVCPGKQLPLAGAGRPAEVPCGGS
jgi:hypothetical protein